MGQQLATLAANPVVTPSTVTLAAHSVVTTSSNTLAGTEELPKHTVDLCCPLCNKPFSNLSCNILWHHINTEHISRQFFPSAPFFALHNRLLCSVGNCHWANHSRFRHSGCQRKISTGSKCGRTLAEASLAEVNLACSLPVDEDIGSVSTDSSFSTSSTAAESYHTCDLLSFAVEATETLQVPEKCVHLESELVDLMLDRVGSLQVSTITHIPHNIRPLFSQTFCRVLQAATWSGVWGFVQLLLFQKQCCVFHLDTLPQGERSQNRY